MSSLIGDKKRAVRGAVLAKREALSPVLARTSGERIQRRVLTLSAYRAARSIALYSPLGNEVDTSEIRRDALAARKRLYYPKVTDEFPGMFRVRSEADLVPGRHGILEPRGKQRLPRGGGNELAVFVPGVAFDCNGNRLGRGAGWYDRWLGSLGAQVPRIALAYEFQVLEEVPAESSDSPVHAIVTEQRVVTCRSAAHDGDRGRAGGPRSGFHASGR